MATITTVTHGGSSGTTAMSNVDWGVATVTGITVESPSVKTFELELPRAASHKAGQHYELRLTAPDGYQAARLYSAASAADGSQRVALTVDLLPDGEVSPYLHGQVKPGDQLEIRGPLGKFFVWEPDMSDPVLLVGGGSGVVPLRCMLLAHGRAGSSAPITLLYSAPTYDEVIYKQELLKSDKVVITLTRSHPKGWEGKLGRIDAALMRATLDGFDGVPPICYVCGSTPFVEAMADMLVGLGVPAGRIRAERYGGE